MVREPSARLAKMTVVFVCCVALTACGADRIGETATSRTSIGGTDTNVPSANEDAETAISASVTTVQAKATTAPLAVTTASDPPPASATSVSSTSVPANTSVPVGTVQNPPLVEVGGQDGASAVDRIQAGQNWAPFATFAGVTLVHPSIRIERIGFHESNHDGARQLEPTVEAISPITLDTRNRGTGSRTAADIVVEPGTEIRAPVTGTVIRAGGYVLYCDHQDDFLVIEPDAHPGWEVKLLHINGVMVAAGDRVEAGVTVVAPEATVLPFDSQVDEFTNTPPWPHVHIELVDPSIPDRPSTGGGC